MSDPVVTPAVEPSVNGQKVSIDYLAIAGLIDAVAGSDPLRLPILFRMLWQTDFKMEARAILTITVACRDPLSDLTVLCRDALCTFAELERLAQAEYWQNLGSALGHQEPHACALLNACDHEIARLSGARQARYRSIRSRLESAAQQERLMRGAEIQQIATRRLSLCPTIWRLYEYWRDRG